MQSWAVFVFRRNCPLGSLAHSKAALQTQIKDEGRAGGKILPSCLGPTWLGTWLVLVQPQIKVLQAGRCVPPQPNLSVAFGWGVGRACVGDAPVPSACWREGSHA